MASFKVITFAFSTASGRLSRNQWARIRIPSAMRGDQGWVADPRAALRPMPLGLTVGVGLLLAVLAAPTLEDVHLVGIGGATVLLVGRGDYRDRGESRGEGVGRG